MGYRLLGWQDSWHGIEAKLDHVISRGWTHGKSPLEYALSS